MRNEPSSLSSEVLEQLIARALQLDDERSEQIDLARAREIALELGIREEAWEAAVGEHLAARGPVLPTRRVPGSPSRWQSSIPAALGGLAAGGLMGAVSAASSGDDIMIGSALVAVSVAVAITQTIRLPREEAQRNVAIWWTSTAAGMLAGLGSFSAEVLWFSAWAWAGCAGVGVVLPAVVARVREFLSPTATTPAAQ